MGKNKYKYQCVAKRKRRNILSLEKAREARAAHLQAKSSTHSETLNNSMNDKVTDIEHVTIENDNLECDKIKEEIDILLKSEEIEETIETGDEIKENDDNESKSDTDCQTQSNEELWLVRRQLCRGCHSDGAFWSLQTTTEGDTYGDLLQTYFNIQLCPVSEEEHALSAICALCAARLREARAFSAQAHAVEERFTRLYKQNRVRVLVNDVVIKEDVQEIINAADDSEITDDVEPDTAHSDLDNPEESTDELDPKLNTSKLAQVRCYKTTSKKSPTKKVVTEEDTQKIINDDVFQAPREELTQVRCDRPAPKKIFRLLPSDYEHVGNLYQCTRCDKLYKRNSIRSHVKRHIDSGKKKINKNYALSPSDFERVGNSYKCTRCEKQLKGYRMIHYHVMYTHLKLPRYSCSHCDETFHGLAPFTKHKLEKHSIDDRIKCNACDWSTYLSKSILMKHKNEFHMLGVKKTCPDCDYFCFSQKAMKRHAVKHSTVKEHHCKYCKKSFLRKFNLDFHERIHTGDKRKVCNVCGQAFVQRASLTYHMAKHHPEVRF